MITITFYPMDLIMFPAVLLAGWHLGRLGLYLIAFPALMAAQHSRWWQEFHDEFAKDL